MRNRYYNTDLKRFMNRDTVNGNIVDSQTLNRYAYVNGNPISYIDPFGLARESIADNGGLSTTHLLLDVGGLVPVYGIPLDVLNMLIYLGEGNTKEVIWSGVGLVPVAGDTVSGVRLTNKMVNSSGLHFPGVGNVDKVSKSGKGYIKYGKLDSLGRTTGAEAYITKDMIGTGSGAVQRIKPTGYVSGKPPVSHHIGHLIANVLGGSGKDRRNLTTLEGYANSPVMRGHEKDIKDKVRGGENIKYNVKTEFIGEEKIARGVTINAKGDNGYKKYVTILNRRKKW